MGEIRPPQPVKRTGTPESSLTRRRQSAVVQRCSQDEHSSKSNESATQNGPGTRSSALRPSSRLNTISALPKYRPKSTASEVAKQPPTPPPRTSTRRRFQASEDEKEDQSYSMKLNPATSSSNRKARPISPLPLRALNRSSGVVNPSPPSTPSRSKPATPSSAKFSPSIPSRAPKAVKTATSSTAPQSNSNSPRLSSSSSSCSVTPRTPKTNAIKGTSRRSERGSTNEKGSGTTTPSPRRFQSDSPLTRQQPRRVVDLTHDSQMIGNMSHISEATSEEEDVALLLAPIADPSAPTPAMPRLIRTRPRDEQPLVTPARHANTLPSRSQMSYLSPLPPGESPSFLRVQKPSGDERIFRGSIMSWEQMATEASKTLGEDEVHSMLADVPAPFGSVPISPTVSSIGMDIPDSPCLSALNSPGAFGSISQVLLPDVTPSPAVHTGTFKYDSNNDLGPVDGAIVTLLRLQLVAVENTAKERLKRLQMMEEEMHNLKEEHKRETSELSTQIVRMQEVLHEQEEEEERTAVERAAYTVSLEEQLREAKVSMQRVVQDEIMRFKQSERRSRQADLRLRHVVGETTCAARVAQTCWDSVHELSEAEVEMVKGDRQLLSIVLAELDRMILLVQ
ncbi:hypothetical protein M378DRAFT_155905 [Amanita muscaria Koide BX008]|uniref:Uncharacterized protein n=1 Tax=Amanita muscaria (strain Koide BX008) TaxID=946122 RepID=A0A0C2XP64_AMAMK|nr:hypothetical protein M378DRAFT_155905 [Amanita muscaria Koide BX008]